MQKTTHESGDKGVADILAALDITIQELNSATAHVEAVVDLFDNHTTPQTTLTLADGTSIHKFQMVEHEIELPFDDDGSTTWVIKEIDTSNMEVTLMVPGAWDFETVSFKELMEDEYTPLTHSGGVPQYGY